MPLDVTEEQREASPAYDVVRGHACDSDHPHIASCRVSRTRHSGTSASSLTRSTKVRPWKCCHATIHTSAVAGTAQVAGARKLDISDCLHDFNDKVRFKMAGSGMQYDGYQCIVRTLKRWV